MSPHHPRTLPLAAPAATSYRRFKVEVVDGEDEGTSITADDRRCSVGTQEGNDLVLTDPTVSRFHCEIAVDSDGGRFRVDDLGSKNGIRVGGIHLLSGSIASGHEITVGRTRIKISSTNVEVALEAGTSASFGELIGESAAMRDVFTKLERAAASDATVLIEGETGTGKEGAAVGLHSQSVRAAGPFVVLDCGALPANLVESELFGHEAGSFTGARGRQIGAFEEANNGTLFLDEIGELGIDLQPKLLRALESRSISRIGSREQIPCDVRVVAATNRDLRAEVNNGAFRADLYYRLAVVRLRLPALRERPGDFGLLAQHLLTKLGADSEQRSALTSDEFVAQLARAPWLGNVRELRNHLEHCLVMRELTPPESGAGAQALAEGSDEEFDLGTSYDEARRRSIESFERRYIGALLESHGGKVAVAAKEAGINRAYLYRLIKKYSLKG